MKFVQLHPFYPAYIESFFTRDNSPEVLGYEQSMAALRADGYSAVHMFIDELPNFGFQSQLIIPNCESLQRQWARENGLAEKTMSLGDILISQLDTIKPEILYIADPITYGGSLIRSLRKRPRLVMAWRAAPIPEGTNLSCFDIIVSSDASCRELASKLGARSTRELHPGFPDRFRALASQIPKTADVVFTGQISPVHKRRAEILTQVAKAPLAWRGDFEIAYYLLSPDVTQMPIGLAMHDHGCRFGSGMYRALLSGRIALNVHIDMGRDPGQNMRIYEALGIGSFLLTEESDQLREHFTPGLHLDTYKTAEELIDKIYYYLAHDKEREEIATAGQNRCLETCNLLSRASMLNDIILEEMQRPPKSRWNRMLSGIFGSRN